MTQLDNYILKHIYTFVDRWEDKWSFICSSQQLFDFLLAFSIHEISTFHTNLFENKDEIIKWFHYLHNEDWHGLDYLECMGLYDMYPTLTEIGLVQSIELMDYKLVHYMLSHKARNIEGAVRRLRQISSQCDDTSYHEQIYKIYYWLLFYQSMYWQESNLKLIS